MGIRLEDGSYLALASKSVKPYTRYEHGKVQHVRGYSEGWIPEDLWQIGQELWKQRGEAAWEDNGRTTWDANEWRTDARGSAQTGSLVSKRDGTIGQVTSAQAGRLGDLTIQSVTGTHHLIDKTGHEVPGFSYPDKKPAPYKYGKPVVAHKPPATKKTVPEPVQWQKTPVLTGNSKLDAMDAQLAIDNYIGEVSGAELNQALRDGTYDPEIDVGRDELDSLIASHRFARPTLMYRGIAMTPELAKQIRPGHDFTDKAFTSVTTDRKLAFGFADLRATGKSSEFESKPGQYHAFGGKPMLIEVHIPEGTHGQKMSSPRQENIEHEILLARNTVFHVDSIKGNVIEVTVVSAARTVQASAGSGDTGDEPSPAVNWPVARITWGPGEITAVSARVALAQVRSYERREHGRVEHVRSYVTRRKLPSLNTVLRPEVEKAQNLRKIGKLLQPVRTINPEQVPGWEKLNRAILDKHAAEAAEPARHPVKTPRVSKRKREELQNQLDELRRLGKEGWIPQDKWLEGELLWKLHGEQAWNERFLGPHDGWKPDEWRFEKGKLLKRGVVGYRGDGTVGYISSVMGDKEVQVHAADHKIYLVDRMTGRQVHPELVVHDRDDMNKSRAIVQRPAAEDSLDRAASEMMNRIYGPAPAEASPPLPPQRSNPRWMYSPGLIKLQDEVSHQLPGAISDPHQPGQGIQGSVEVLDLKDGSKIIDKSNMGTVDMQRELMAFVVSEAIGAGVPAVTQVGDGEIAEEFVPGKILHDYLYDVMWGDPISFREAQIYTSERGKLIGLLDKLISNFDRHGGNVIVGDDGQPVPIDHGLATFAAGEVSTLNSPFWEYNGNYWRHHLAALQQYRVRLAGLKPEFERIRRVSWWDGVMDQIDHLIEDAQEAQG